MPFVGGAEVAGFEDDISVGDSKSIEVFDARGSLFGRCDQSLIELIWRFEEAVKCCAEA